MSNQPSSIDFLVADKLAKRICFYKMVNLIFVVLPNCNRVGHVSIITVCLDVLMTLKQMADILSIYNGIQRTAHSLRMIIRTNTRSMNEEVS